MSAPASSQGTQGRVAIGVFARAPVPGRSKTRLIPLLGAAGAAQVQHLLMERALTTAVRARLGAVSLWCAPDARHAAFVAAGVRHGIACFGQTGPDLGARMSAAFDRLCATGPAIVIGTDGPALTSLTLQRAAGALAQGCDVVIVPAEDGGYVLIGMRRPVAALFEDVPWGTERVMAVTRERLRAARLHWRELACSWDVDTPRDFLRLRASRIMPEIDALARAPHRLRRSPPAALLATVAAFATVYAVLRRLERRRPLRARVEPSRHRVLRNMAVGAITAAAVMPIERPITRTLAAYGERRGLGLVPRLPLPAPAHSIVAVLLMDYTLYLWHVLLHRAPLLWRFHRVHHADLDLDASTALRFHFGEFLLSIPWRAGQILVLGVSPRALSIWGALTMVEVMFHHSNLRLPAALEAWLSRWVITPRLHGIHHATRGDLVNSNFSSGLALWDVLHRTRRDDVPQRQIVIGLPECRDAADLTLASSLVMPFR